LFFFFFLRSFFLRSFVLSSFLQAATTKTSITMKYEMQSGPCDRSFGIHVAELAQFPADVVEQARFKAMELENLGGPGMEASSAGRPGKRQKTGDEEAAALDGFLSKFVSGTPDAAALAAQVEALMAAPGGSALVQRLSGKKASP